MVSSIVEILKEKNYDIASKKLEKMDNLDSFGSENFLHDIILERWVYRPEDIPFTFAKDIWIRSVRMEDNKKLLLEILEYPISDINKAKINDFLWVMEKDIRNRFF